ncbi:MAG: insulinase family protein [Deltaproteobacteria bacterium]|nr:insulinase family protein [Deltaproteobacteria bacterium]
MSGGNMGTISWRFVLATVALTIGCAQRAGYAASSEPRRIESHDLAIDVERAVLGNGLRVLLSPDPEATGVAVVMTFEAGTLHEPPGRSGLAHLVEHIIYRGTTPDTDDVARLEARQAQHIQATTTPHHMSFEIVVPPEELPIALWVSADRVGWISNRLEHLDLDLERHKRVVDMERVQSSVDVHYGLLDQAIYRRLYPSPHPLRGLVIGIPTELATVTVEDVRQFVATHITASNAVLTITGRFDIDKARAWVEKTVARLPKVARPPPLGLQFSGQPAQVVQFREVQARRPRVSLVWKLKKTGPNTETALALGATLLSSFTDGAFGTQVSARLERYPDSDLFWLEATLPYDKPARAAEQEAEVFLRYLTAVDMPRDFFDATRTAIDLQTMLALDDLVAHAKLITMVEFVTGDGTTSERYLSRHWRFARHDVQHIAWKNLVRGPPRWVIHARPTRPLKARLPWEERP